MLQSTRILKRQRPHKRYEIENLEPRILLSGDPLVGALASIAPGDPDSEESSYTTLEEVLASEESNAYDPPSADSESYDPAESLDDIFSGLTVDDVSGSEVDEAEDASGADETYDPNLPIGDSEETQILLGLTELVRLGETVELSDAMSTPLSGLDGDVSLGELLGLGEILDSRLATSVFDYFGDAVDPPTGEGVVKALNDSLNTLGDLEIKVSSLEGGFVSGDGEFRFDIRLTASREGQLLLGDGETGSDQAQPADYTVTLELDISFGVDLDRTDGFFLVVRTFDIDLTVLPTDGAGGVQPLEALVVVGLDDAAGSDGRLGLDELRAINAGDRDVQVQTAGSLFDTSDANIAPADLISSIEISEGGAATDSLVLDGGSTPTSALTFSPPLGPGSTTEIEIGGNNPGIGPTDYDQIVIAGNADLDGTLNIVVDVLFTPAVGKIFEVITYGSSTGAFDSINVTGLAAGLELIPVQGPDGLFLITVPSLAAAAGLLATINAELQKYIDGPYTVGTDVEVNLGSVDLDGFLQLLNVKLTFENVAVTSGPPDTISAGTVKIEADSALFFPGQALYISATDGPDAADTVAITGTYFTATETFTLNVDQLDVMVAGVLSGHAQTLAVSYDPTGSFVLNVAQLDIDVAGFVSVSGTFSFQESAGEIQMAGSSVSVRMEISSTVFVEMTGAKFGLIASPGQFAFELKDGTLNIQLGPVFTISAGAASVQFSNILSPVTGATTIDVGGTGGVSYTFDAAIANSTVAFSVTGLVADVASGVFTLSGGLGFKRVGPSTANPLGEMLVTGNNVTVRMEATSSVYVELAGANFGMVSIGPKFAFELSSGTLDIQMGPAFSISAGSVSVQLSSAISPVTTGRTITVGVGTAAVSYTFGGAIANSTVAFSVTGLVADVASGVFTLSGGLGFKRVGPSTANPLGEMLVTGNNVTVRMEATSSVYVELAGANFGMVSIGPKFAFELSSGTLDIQMGPAFSISAGSVSVQLSSAISPVTTGRTITVGVGTAAVSYTFGGAIANSTVAFSVTGLVADVASGVFTLSGGLGFKRVGPSTANPLGEMLVTGNNVTVRMEATSSVYVELAGANFGMVSIGPLFAFELSGGTLDIQLGEFAGITAADVFVLLSGAISSVTGARTITVGVGAAAVSYSFTRAIANGTVAIALDGFNATVGGGALTITGNIGFSKSATLLKVVANPVTATLAVGSVSVAVTGAKFGLKVGLDGTTPVFVFELKDGTVNVDLSPVGTLNVTRIFVQATGPTTTITAGDIIQIGPSVQYVFGSDIAAGTIAIFIDGNLQLAGGGFRLDGTFEFVADTSSLRLLIIASMNMAPLGQLSVSGDLRISDAGIVGGLALGGNLTLGPLTIVGAFTLEVNSTSGPENVERFVFDSNTETFAVDGSNQPITQTVSVASGTVRLFAFAKLKLTSSFTLEGSITFANTPTLLSLDVDMSMVFFGTTLNVAGAARVVKSGATGLVLNLVATLDSSAFGGAFYSFSANLKLQINTRGGAGSDANDLGLTRGSFRIEVTNASLTLLSIITLNGSGFIQFSGGVFSMQVSLSGNFLSVATITATAFFSSEGEFEVSLSGGLFLGVTGFNVSATASATVSLLDNNLKLPGGDLNLVLRITGNFGVTATIFFIPISMNVGLAYNSLSGDITISVGPVPVPGIAWVTVDLGFLGSARVPYPTITFKSFSFTIGRLLLGSAPPPPVLGVVTSNVLTLNVGSRASQRNLQESELDEGVIIEGRGAGSVGQTIRVSMFGVTQDFDNVTSIVANTAAGNDFIEVDHAVFVPIVANLGDGADIFNSAGSGTATVSGGVGDDRLSGGTAADNLSGGPGSDELTGRAGVDTINGGNDGDRYIWSAGDGNDTINDTGTGGSDQVSIIGTVNADQITISGSGTGFTFAVGAESVGVNGVEVAEVEGRDAGDTFAINNLTSTLSVSLLLGSGGVDTVTFNGSTGAEAFDLSTAVASRTVVVGGTPTVTNVNVYRVLELGAATVDIIDAAAGDTVTLNAGGGNDVINVRSLRAGLPTTVNGGGGTDTINVGSNALGTTTSPSTNSGGNLNSIGALLTVNGNGSGDTLNVDDGVDGFGNTGQLTNTAITGLGMGGSITYGTVATLNIGLGSGGDTFLVASTHGGTTNVNANGGNDVVNVRTIAGATSVNGGAGTDTINVGTNAPATAGNLNLIGALLTVNGNGDGDTLNVDDTGDSSGNTGVLSSTSITQLGMGGSITYGTVETLNIGLGSGGDTFTLQSTHGGTTNVNANGGGDVVNVRTIAGPTTVNGGAGADTINVGTSAPGTSGNVNFIGALLTVNGNGNGDTLNVDDTGDSVGNPGVLSSTSITQLGMGGSITYGTVETLNIGLGSGGDTFTIQSTHAGTTNLNTNSGADTVHINSASGTLTVDAGAGTDTINVNATGTSTIVNLEGSGGADVVNVRTIGGPTTVNGGTGTDTINVGSNASGTISSPSTNSNGNLNLIGALLTVNGTGSGNRLNVDDTLDSVGNPGQLTNTRITQLGMGGSNTYGTFATLNIGLGSGGDTFTIQSTHAGTTSLDTNNGGDTVHINSASGTLTVDAGAGTDTINVNATGTSTIVNLEGSGGADVVNVRTIGGPTTVNGGTGTDTINVGSNASGTISIPSTNSNGNLNSIGALLTVNGQSTGDTLNVDDTLDSVGNTGELTDIAITGLGMGGSITYGTIATLNIGLGSGGDLFRIQSTHVGTTNLNANGGADVVNVRTIDGPTTVNGGVGADTINVGSNADGTTATPSTISSGNLNSIDALLTVNGQSTGDTLNVDDTLDSVGNTGDLTNTITGLGMGGSITYGTIATLNIGLGSGGDVFTIQSTHVGTTNLNANDGDDVVNVQTIAGPTFLNTGTDDDTINVGDTGDTTDQISALLTIDGGAPSAGSDILNIFDSGDTTDNIGFLTDDGVTTRITGLEMALGIEYIDIEDLNVFLGSGNDIFNVSGTGSATWIYAGAGGDAVNVHRIEHETLVFGQTGDDRIHVGVAINAASGFLELIGGGLVDPRTTGTGAGETPAINLSRNTANLIGADLTLDGRDGGDQYFIWLASTGGSLINVFDSGAVGGDFLTVLGSQGDDLFLLRAGVIEKDLTTMVERPVPVTVTAARAGLVSGDLAAFGSARIGFVALMNAGDTSTPEDVERLNYSRNIEENTGINGNLIVQGVGGNDRFHVDDNLAPTQLFGGSTSNYFQFGQLYHSARANNVFAGITDPADQFRTVETTRGFISNGISFDLTAVGALNGPNQFVIINNQATLNMLGGDQNDIFTVRSFAHVGSVDASRRDVDISTGGGANLIEYVVGAPINIDGGGGFNTLKIIGTEFGDDYVVTEDGVFGAGRLVNFVNIQELEVDAAEGNDRFFILSTAPGTSVVLSGGLGSDVFWVGGESPDIIANDLRGHSGIISHGVGSSDPAFGGLKTDEIAANVGDNDEAGLVVTEEGGETVIVEGVRLDSYTVVLTRAPTGPVTVTASAPRAIVRVGTRPEVRPVAQLAKSSGGTFADTVELVFGPTNWDVPQTVWIQAAQGQQHSGIVAGFIGHDVAGDRILGTTTSALRVVGQDPNQLVDTTANFGATDSLRGAKVLITEGPGLGQSRNIVGNTATTLTFEKPWILDEVSASASTLAVNQSKYQISLFEGIAIPVVNVKAYFAGSGAAILTPGGGLQVIEQPTGVNFAAPGSFVGSYDVVLPEAPASSVVVSVVPGVGLQTDKASLTFTNLNWNQPQTVRVAIGADGIVQKTRLLEIEHFIGPNAIESALVRVIDGDSPTVVITESDGSTSVIEDAAGRTDVPRADTYTVVLSQQPTSNVEVVVRAEGTRTTKGRVVNFGEQVRLASGGSAFANTVTLVFTPANWNLAQTVEVKALDDGVVDGGETKVFPRLGDDTSRIQGPLRIQGGGGQGSLVGLPTPILLPGETNEFLPSGEIQQPAAAGSNSVVVSAADLNNFIIKYGLNFGQEPGAGPFDALVSKTFRILDGLNGTEFDRRFGPLSTTGDVFNPADPVLQRLVPFREIASVLDLGGGLVRLTFELTWNFPVSSGDEYALVNASPGNFFAVEEDQVDLLLVFDSDARSDEDGSLIFNTADDPALDVPVAFTGQLVGLGMSPGRTIGNGADATNLPAGIVFDEIEMMELTLDSGGNHLVIEGTHSGSTRVNGGAGVDRIEVLTASGPITINGGPGDNIITVGEPTATGRTLAGIAALVTIGGDVPSALARTTVRGELDVLAPGGELIAQGSTNEQEIILNAGGGTFTLRFKGPVVDSDLQPPPGIETAPIAYDADAATIKQALVALPGLAAGDFEVARFGNRIVIRFTETGAFEKTPMHVFGTGAENLLQSGTNTLNVIGSADGLDTWAVLTGSTLTGLGMPVPNAIQTIFVDDPQPGDAVIPFVLNFDGSTTGSLTVNSSAAEVQAALEGLSSIGEGNVEVDKVDNVFIVRFQGDLTNQVLGVLSAGVGDSHVFIAVRESGIDKLDASLFPPSADTLARNDLQTLTIDATGGTFTLEFGGTTTGALAHNATADEVRDALQRLVGSQFADDIAVGRFGTAYHIRFQGILRQLMGGSGAGFMKVDATGLTGVNPTATLDTRMDGINYYFIDELNIDFGSGSDVLNVQGTTAGVTNIALNNGDDRILVSSDADLDSNTLAPLGAAYGFDFLTGHLDLILGDLNIDAGSGRHIMMISDEATALAKGTTSAPVTIQRVGTGFVQPGILGDIEIEILDLNLVGSAIRYGAAGNGNFYDGITLWGGQNGNVLDVSATHLRQNQQWRTQTMFNTGNGADTVTVNLLDGSDDFFELNAQGGGDVIDASGSTLPLVIFGGDGGDTIDGGEGGDLIFGDRGRIVYLDELGGISTVLGHGGSYDLTDGRKLPPNVIFTVDPFEGGLDEITTGAGADTIVGGRLRDIIDAGEGDNTVVGDAAWIEIDFGLSEVNAAAEHASAVPLRVESVLDTFDLQRAWSFDIDPFTPADLVIAGGADSIDTGSDNDIVAGGLGGDDITIVGGHNNVLGDNGIVTFQEGTRTLDSVVSTYLEVAAQTFVQGGADTIETGTGNDVVIAGLGDDGITITGGNNIVLGDDGSATFQAGSGLPNRIESRYLDGAGLSALDAAGVVVGNDTIETGSGSDVIIGGLGGITVPGAVTIAAGDGDNIVLADEGFVQYQDQTLTVPVNTSVLREVSSLYLDNTATGDLDLDTFVQGGDERITTGAHNDIVIGSLGNDDIVAGNGDNIVIADEGGITYQTGTGLRDLITSRYLNEAGFAPMDAIDASVGNDLVETGTGNDVVIGGLGFETITVADGNNIISGDEGFIQYQAQAVTLPINTSVLREVSSMYLDLADTFVQGGNDTITVGASIGSTGAGSDIVIAGLGNDGITIGNGDNIVIADEGGITYQTGAGLRDLITSRYLDGAGLSALDAAEAVVGNDTIETGSGSDVIIGGLGGITVPGAVTIAAGDGDNIVLADEGFVQYQDQTLTVPVNTSVLREVSSLYLDNTATGDLDLDTFVQGGDERITTGAHNDIVIGSLGNDDIVAGNGDNIVIADEGGITYQTGTGLRDLITSRYLNEAGFAPMDAIDASVGNDLVETGSGSDVIIGGLGGITVPGAVTIAAGDGDNIVLADEGFIQYQAQNLTGNTSVLREVSSLYLDNTATGDLDLDTFVQGGDERITTGAHNDIVIGSLGNDDIVAGNGDNIVIADEGGITYQTGTGLRDLITSRYLNEAGFAPMDAIDASVGNDLVETGTGNDVVIGGLGFETITVADGNNIIFGDEGFIQYQAQAVTLPINTSVLREVSSMYLDLADTFVQGGNDTITVGASIGSTGAGSDIVIAGLGNDGITIGNGDNIVIADEGGITYQTGAGLRDLITSRYLDGAGLSALDAAEAVVGNDTIETGSGSDVIIGGLGGITVPGAVTIAAGDGDNIVLADEGFIQYQAQNLTGNTSVLREVSTRQAPDCAT